MTIYHPIIGFFKYFMPPKGSKDDLELMKKLYVENCNSDLLVSNSIEPSSSLILLLGRDIITEFFNKEFKISKKIPFLAPLNFGLIDISGENALRKRSIFKQFFHQDNLDDVLPRLHAIIKRHIVKIESDNWNQNLDRKEFKVVDFSSAMNNLFADIVDFILLGNTEGHFA